MTHITARPSALYATLVYRRRGRRNPAALLAPYSGAVPSQRRTRVGD